MQINKFYYYNQFYLIPIIKIEILFGESSPYYVKYTNINIRMSVVTTATAVTVPNFPKFVA